MPGRGSHVLRKLDKYVGVPLVFCLGMMTTAKTVSGNDQTDRASQHGGDWRHGTDERTAG